MCGVKTNIITAIDIDDVHSADSPMPPKLVNATANAFHDFRVSADAAYGGAKNVAAITVHNATPFMAFKRNTMGMLPRL